MPAYTNQEYYDMMLCVGRRDGVLTEARDLYSRNLTPLDFFLWGYMKSLVYVDKCDDENVMRDRITSAFEEIRRSPEVLRNVILSVGRRASLCIQRQGRHIEPFL